RTPMQLAGSDRTMPREPQALISMPVATPVSERRRTERLSPPAAIFWIAVLSLAGWAAVIALVLRLV
ncbi:MAG: hypothetical protein WCA23_12290, partial [Stellaceae bacterium]